MVDDELPRDLSERIRGIASSLTGEHELGAGGDGLVDAAVQSLGAMLQRWGRSASLRHLVGGVRRDALIGAGERLELEANLGVPGRLGELVRFFVGDVMAGEVEIGAGGEVHTEIVAPAPGLHRLRVEVRGRDGSLRPLAGQRLLQVVHDRPVALVHAELLLDARRHARDATCEALHALAPELELAYFDFHEEDRYALVFDALQRLELPSGAILTHPASEAELRLAGLSFVELFASTRVRWLRAKGVPVTTVLSDRYGETESSRAEGVTITTPAKARARLARGERAEAAWATRMLREKAETAPFDWRLDQTTGSRRVEGNTFHAELDNHAARTRVFEAIDAAESTIHAQVYIVRPSRFTDSLIVRLIRRARAGVRVRFMVDALYSDQEVLGRLNTPLRSLEAEPNVELLAVAPIESREQVTLSNLKRRDHRKLLVLDGQRAFVSGRNASDEYYTGFDEVPVHDYTPHEHIPWLDAHVEIAGPLVAEIRDDFLETWQRQGGAAIERDADVCPELEPVGSAVGRMVVHHGLGDTNGLAMYEAMLDAAEHHVYVVNDFPFVPAVERALRRLLTRGVRVQLLTGNAAPRRADGTFFPAPLHRMLFEYMVKGKLEPLIADGLEAYEFVGPRSEMVVARGGTVRPYVHAKMVSVDGRATSIGSANLDATASYWESEANVLVQDETFARGVEATLAELIARSVRLELDSEYWRGERAQRAVVSKLWPGSLYS